MQLRTRRVRPSLGEVDYSDPDQWMVIVKTREAGGFLIYLTAGGLVQAPDGHGWVRHTEKSAQRLARRVITRKRRALTRARGRRARLDITPSDDGLSHPDPTPHAKRMFHRAA